MKRNNIDMKNSKITEKVFEPITIIKSIGSISYNLQYPTTGAKYIDKRIAHIVHEICSDFNKKYFNLRSFFHRYTSKKITLLLNYETHIFSVSHLSLIFFETHESNGLSSTQIHIYHFDLKEDREQKAEDLMYKNFQEIAVSYTRNFFCETDFYKRELLENYIETLKAGNRFNRFALTKDGVLFYFEPGSILPEKHGLIRLIIPYEDMQPNVPLPSILQSTRPTSSQKINMHKPMVALTFDDGPNPIYTQIILDTLEKYKATATFFDLGDLMEQFPSVSQRESSLSCEVACHSYNHKNYTRLSDSEIIHDMNKTAEIFHKVLMQDPAFFRPPYGCCDDRIKKLVNMPLILWSVDTRDWESRNPETILNVIKQYGNLDGKVILMHSIYESSARAVAMLIPYLLDKNYQLVTISQMIKLKYGESPKDGKLYF